MRVVCIHPAREPALHPGDTLSIGSATDNDVVAAGGEAHHATITLDRRGLVLDVCPGSQRVYVNARPVRERAMLRYGDAITVGAQKFMVTSDVEPALTDFNERDAVPAPVALRLVSGTDSGRSLAVSPELRLGLGSRHFGDLAYSCLVTQAPGGLAFESDSATPRVNGWHCKAARLHPGDQITLGEHRLVVDGPSLEHAAHVATLPPPAPPAPPVEPEADATHAEVWWLIGAATLLAGLIALFLYIRW